MGEKNRKSLFALFSCQWIELYVCVCEVVAMVLFWLMLETAHSAAQLYRYGKGSK